MFLLRGGQMLWAIAREIMKKHEEKPPDSKVGKVCYQRKGGEGTLVGR